MASRLVHIRGWAPSGTGSSTHINCANAKRIREEPDKCFPPDIRRRYKWLAPFMSNHRLTVEILKVLPGDAKLVADAINEQLSAEKYFLHDKQVYVSPETSPDRIKPLKERHRQHEVVAKLNLIEVCMRALEIWDKSATIRLGHFLKPEDE